MRVKRYPNGLGLPQEVLQDPTFPEEEIERNDKCNWLAFKLREINCWGVAYNSCVKAVWGSILWDDFFGSGGDRLFPYT